MRGVGCGSSASRQGFGFRVSGLGGKLRNPQPVPRDPAPWHTAHRIYNNLDNFFQGGAGNTPAQNLKSSIAPVLLRNQVVLSERQEAATIGRTTRKNQMVEKFNPKPSCKISQFFRRSNVRLARFHVA